MLGEECRSHIQLYEWFRQNVYIKKRSGRPATSRTEKNIADVSAAARVNDQITIRELSVDV